MAFSPLLSRVLYNVFLLIVTSVLTLLFGLVVYIKYNHFRYRHIPSPKRSSFLLGHFHLVQEHAKKDAIGKLNYILYKELGLIYILHIIHRPIVFVLDAKFVKEILTNSQHTKPFYAYSKFHSLFGTRVAGNGLVSEINHDKWKKKRALFNPAFRRQYLMGLIEEFNVSADKLIDHIGPLADGTREVTMLSEFNNVTLDIIARVGFAMNLDVIEDAECPFPKAATLVLKGIMEAIRTPWLGIIPSRSAADFRYNVKKAVRLIRDTGREVIRQRIAAMERGDDIPRDILTHILKASDNLSADSDFGMEEMIDEFFTFFIAGQETTSNLLAFTIQQLSRYPDVLDKLKVELEEKLGDKQFVSYADLTELDYMMLVLKETMRLYPPVQGTSRVLHMDTKFDKYVIYKGTQVVMNTLAMGMMERYFDNPEDFRPERFRRQGDEPVRHLYAYFPFSVGQRSCIGQHFALIEAQVILAKLLRRFHFSLVPGQSFTVISEITSKPRDGCMTYITQL